MLTNPSIRPLLHYAVPLGIVVASLLLGLLLQRIVFRRLLRLAERSANRWDDALMGAMRGMLPIWALLAGGALALKAVALTAGTTALLHRGVALLAIFSVVVFSSRLAVGLVTEAIGRFRAVPTSLFRNITWAVVYAVGALIILDYVGISITPIITALGVGGLAVALALQETLSNFFAGVHLLVSQKVRPGDYIRLDSGDEGTVADISWRNTTIHTAADNLVVVPNGKLAAAIVTNFSLPQPELTVAVEATAALDSDLERVERVALEEARSLLGDFPGAVAGAEPVLRFQAFTESGVRFSVFLRARVFADQFAMRHAFIKRLHARFRREGLELPVPGRTVRLRDR
jgi:small-conductance mechanosensitive channel